MKSEVSNGDEFYFQWHITERCNKRCMHCYQGEYPATDLSLADLEVVLNRMEEALVKWGRWGSLSLTGGEPFVRQSELFALMRRIDQMHSFVFYDVLTNGSLVSDDVAIDLKSLQGLRRVQVSLESSKPEVNDVLRLFLQVPGATGNRLRPVKIFIKVRLMMSIHVLVDVFEPTYAKE